MCLLIDGTVELLTKKKCQRKEEQNVQSFVNHTLSLKINFSQEENLKAKKRKLQEA